MTSNEYQKFTRTTNQYPPDRMTDCLVYGLASEVGEVCGLLKKKARGDNFELYDFNAKLKAETGDLLWYVSELCNEMGWTLEGLMQLNADKLRG